MTPGPSPGLSCADCLRALYELPLGLGSAAMLGLLRGLVYTIGLRAYRRKPETFRSWSILSGEMLERPHQLSRYLVVAPRWNPHAAVGSAGPMPVKGEIAIDLSGITAGIQYWSFGAYHFPSFVLAAHASALSEQAGADLSLRLKVPEGDYYVACRYYGWQDKLRYPAISVDGAPVIDPIEAAGTPNDFYADLYLRGNGFYHLVHYHIYVMLKYRRFFSRAFVERHLLPVGNDDTEYVYGFAKRGQVLRFVLDPAMLGHYRVFATVYDTASLPVLMFELSEATHLSDAMPCNSIYLIRVMRMNRTHHSPGWGAGRVTVCAEAATTGRHV